MLFGLSSWLSSLLDSSEIEWFSALICSWLFYFAYFDATAYLISRSISKRASLCSSFISSTNSLQLLIAFPRISFQSSFFSGKKVFSKSSATRVRINWLKRELTPMVLSALLIANSRSACRCLSKSMRELNDQNPSSCANPMMILKSSSVTTGFLLFLLSLRYLSLSYPYL